MHGRAGDEREARLKGACVFGVDDLKVVLCCVNETSPVWEGELLILDV